MAVTLYQNLTFLFFFPNNDWFNQYKKSQDFLKGIFQSTASDLTLRYDKNLKFVLNELRNE